MSTIKSSAEDLTLNADGSGNDIKFQSDAVEKGSLTDGGVWIGSTFEPTGDTAASDNAAIGYTATEGLILTGQGSTNDLTIKNDADTTVFTIPTGTDRGLSQFTAKAWINFNGQSTVAIRDSHNVSSITDNGTGSYNVTMSNAMGNVNYSVTATSGRSGGEDMHALIPETAYNQTTTQFRILTLQSWDTAHDASYVSAHVFGD